MWGARRRPIAEIEEVDAALHRLGRLLFDRDPAFAGEFADDGLLIGSEPGERAEGREAIAALVAGLYALPVRIIWDWRSIAITVDRDVSWLFADGEVVQTSAEGRKTQPYRLSGVLTWNGRRWLWRLFHGSEPKV